MKLLGALLLTLALCSTLNAMDTAPEDESIVNKVSDLVWGVCELLYNGFEIEVIPEDVGTLFAPSPANKDCQ